MSPAADYANVIKTALTRWSRTADPDRWYEIEYKALELRLKIGEISKESFQEALEDLYGRYEQMIDRLDGTYQIF